MTDPLNPTDGNLNEAGLNSSDTEDWAGPKTAGIAKLMAFVILPSIFILIALFALFWGLTHQKNPAAASVPATTSAPAMAGSDPQKDAQIAALQNQIAGLQGQLHTGDNTTVAPTQPLYTTDPTALSQLSARLDRVEANQQALARAATSAFAARTLQLAAHTEQPFLSELAVVETGVDDPGLVAALRPYAEKGVPSEVTLAVKFPAVAARANIAAQADDGKDNLFSKLRHALGGFISVRRTDNANGQGSEAILERAEIRLNNGDLKGAVAYLSTLSPTAQKALSPWLDQARARVLVDDTTRHISESALNRLSRTTTTDAALRNGGVL